MVSDVLAETTLEPHFLELEITESLLVNDTQEINAILSKLKEMNIKIAIDDFGTGYSSLSRLKEMSIDCLKIDRSFVNGIHGGTKDQAIISAIIAMAKGMGIKAIAEGVETTGQIEFLRKKQCQEVQGYLFSRPLPTQQAEAFLLQSFKLPGGSLPLHHASSSIKNS
jgi:EAL domain-containing protein (putative c-di-GMP-specific phosphodiesterase class I)